MSRICPVCGDDRTIAYRTTNHGLITERYRKCNHCQAKFVELEKREYSRTVISKLSAINSDLFSGLLP